MLNEVKHLAHEQEVGIALEGHALFPGQILAAQDDTLRPQAGHGKRQTCTACRGARK